MGLETSAWALVACASLSAWAPLALLETKALRWVKDEPFWLGAFGAALICGLYWCGRLAIAKLAKTRSAVDTAMAGFFLMTCWSATIDTFLALSLVGKTELGLFYHSTGEPYFKTAWGLAALAYDGTAHLMLQGTAAVALITGANFLPASLVWAGSIINSMPVLLVGAATGPFSAHINPSTALNAPYVLIPIAVAWRCFSATSRHKDPWPTTPKALEAALAFFHLVALVIRVVRSMAVLNSGAAVSQLWAARVEPVLLEPTGFARVQVLEDLFYVVPWHAASAFESGLRLAELAPRGGLVTRETFWRLELAFAGAALQAQTCWLSMATIEWHDFSVRVASERYSVPSIVICLCMALVPAAQAFVHGPERARLAGKANAKRA